MEMILFYLFSAMCIISALLVLFLKNPVFSAMFLVACMFGVAGFFALLNAHFLAVIQIAVYAGAIIVLMLFVIMLLNINAPLEPKRNKFFWLAGFACFALIIGKFINLITLAFQGNSLNPLAQTKQGHIENLGMLLFSDYVFTFELASILILAALVGVVLIARTK